MNDVSAEVKIGPARQLGQKTYQVLQIHIYLQKPRQSTSGNG